MQPNVNPDSTKPLEKLYCVCQKPEEKSRFMISCDQCSDWFHGNCVDVTEEAGKLMEENNEPFVCPKCQKPGIEDLPIPTKWYSDGPSFALFPYTVIDETRSTDGNECSTCGTNCSGHYVTDLQQYLVLFSEGKAIRSPPPSEILQEFYSKHKDLDPSESDIKQLAKICLLPVHEVEIWLDHLKQVDQNRKMGAEKAKETRKKKKEMAQKSRSNNVKI